MKLRDRMIWQKNKFIITISSALFSCMSLFLTGCREEVNTPSNPAEEYEGVTIRVPIGENQPKFVSTRDEGYDLTAPVVNPESNIQDIYLIVVKNESNGDKFEIVPLSQPTASTEGSNTYLDYKTPLESGYYKFFVIANIKDYILASPTEVIYSEAKLKEVVASISSTDLLRSDYLPMACMETTVSGTNTSNYVYVQRGTSVIVMAPLSFLCSKVRYTILFDAQEGGFSSGFGEKRIRFDIEGEEPYATNIGTIETSDGYIEISGILGNTTFTEPNVNGWEEEAQPDNGGPYGEGLKFGDGVAEFFDCKFYMQKTLKNMPAGHYRLELQGFYRNGSIENAKDNHTGNEVINSIIYINLESVPFKCLYDEDKDYFPNYDYPNDRASANRAFVSGKYKNSLNYDLSEDGDLTIGIKKDILVPNDWTCFDNFKLYYKPYDAPLGNKTIPLDRYTLPDPSYPTSANDNLSSFVGNDAQWFNLNSKAWQGVAYLPVNNSTDKNAKTTLHFPYCFGEEITSRNKKSLILFDESNDSSPTHDSGSKVTHGLERGMFYDVVIKVVSSQAEEDEFTLYVTVKNWNYNPEDAEW